MRNDHTIVTITGKHPGKTVSVLGGVHGNEVSGVIAVIEALLAIPIERGRVHFILGNPKAIAAGVRYTEMNLNRAFKPKHLLSPTERNSYERKRAETLMPFLRRSDALLDIHSGSNLHTTPFIICEPHSFAIAKYLPFPIVSHGWDKIEPGGTDYFVNRKRPRGQGICIECGFHFDPQAPQRALEAVKRFFMCTGIISGKRNLVQRKQKKVFVKFAHQAKHSFVLARQFKDFEPVEKGMLIGSDGPEKIYARFDGVIVFAKNVSVPGSEAFILGTVR